MGSNLSTAFSHPNDKQLMKKIFDNYDHNKDGKISKEEFQKIGLHFVEYLEDSHKNKTGENLEKEYQKYIKDVPKGLTILKATASDSQLLIDTLFNEIDLDKNGTLSYEEFDQWICNMEKTKVYKYKSYAQLRSGVNAVGYTNGRYAFEDIYEAMNNAKSEIFMSGWFVSPELYLKRVIDKQTNELISDYRLDKVITKKASEGVHIYIIIWNESDLMFKNNSYGAEQTFLRFSKNVKVIRHPNVIPFTYMHHQKTIIIDQEIAFLGGIDACFGRYDDEDHKMFDDDEKIWPGKDYTNPDLAGTGDLEFPSKDYFDRLANPRMPWHDIHCRVDGYAARDVAYNFIQRWNHHNEQRSFLNQYPILRLVVSEPQTKKGTCDVQILRSASKWSVGVEETETSVYNAMTELIENSEHFIFIENQYFLTLFVEQEKDNPITNKLGIFLLNRLRKAIKEEQDYRVVVILPVHPDGNWNDFATKFIIGHEIQCIALSENSLFKILKREFPNVDLNKYIHYFSLRTAEPRNGKFYQQQVYVHCKFMIVDDRYALIGSANLNDRSLKGDRDSEISALITDREEVLIEMNGKPFKASKFVHEMRMRLYKQHLRETVDISLISDPIKSFSFIVEIAETNLEIFKKIFPLTTDKNLSEMKVLSDTAPENEENKLLFKKIFGRLTSFRFDILTLEQIKKFFSIDVLIVGEKSYI